MARPGSPCRYVSEITFEFSSLLRGPRDGSLLRELECPGLVKLWPSCGLTRAENISGHHILETTLTRSRAWRQGQEGEPCSRRASSSCHKWISWSKWEFILAWRKEAMRFVMSQLPHGRGMRPTWSQRAPQWVAAKKPILLDGRKRALQKDNG